ncbi:hypothetical protein ACFLTI_08595, partial [Bacteroidota bacterium]
MKILISILFTLIASSLFAQTTIFSDSFSGSFPSVLFVGNDDGITGTKWGGNSYRSSGEWETLYSSISNDGSETFTG